MEIKNWKDLDGQVNNNCMITVTEMFVKIGTTYGRTLSLIRPYVVAPEIIIAWLKLFGFDIKFIEQELEEDMLTWEDEANEY